MSSALMTFIARLSTWTKHLQQIFTLIPCEPLIQLCFQHFCSESCETAESADQSNTRNCDIILPLYATTVLIITIHWQYCAYTFLVDEHVCLTYTISAVFRTAD